MIKEIVIRNFLSHKATTLNLHKGVNTIIGMSASGKTNIIRALEWIRTNKPKGNAVCSHWGGRTFVKIETMEGDIIGRFKSKKENSYKLNKSVAKTPAGGVPEDISKVLNLQDINVQDQFNPVFLLNKSGGEVTRAINKVTDLSAIDEARSFLTTKIRQNNQNAQTNEQLENKMAFQMKELSYLPRMGRAITGLKKAQSTLEKIHKKTKGITYLLNELEDVQTRIKETQQIEEDNQRISKLNVNSLRKINLSISSIDTLLTDLETCQHEITLLNVEIDQAEQQLVKIIPEVCPLCEQPIKKGNRNENYDHSRLAS